MKIKGPIQVKGLYFYGENTEVEITISTPALIEELGKRRPCKRCKCLGLSTICSCCIWDIHGDNFKEANHGK